MGLIQNAAFDHVNLFSPFPIVAKSARDSANSVIKVKPDRRKDDVVGLDIILFWGEDKGVLTGADVLGRLLRSIVQNIGTGI
jgi:hypothetical protein